MKLLIKMLSLFLLFGCSTLTMEPAEPDMPSSSMPKTKSPSTLVQEPNLTDAELRHHFQTNHRSILIKHIVLRDGVYVQTLTPEDMNSLKITYEEQSYGNAYLVQMNEMIEKH